MVVWEGRDERDVRDERRRMCIVGLPCFFDVRVCGPKCLEKMKRFRASRCCFSMFRSVLNEQ